MDQQANEPSYEELRDQLNLYREQLMRFVRLSRKWKRKAKRLQGMVRKAQRPGEQKLDIEDDKRLRKALWGALQCAVRDHGPIESDTQIRSVVKRAVGALITEFIHNPKQQSDERNQDHIDDQS